VWARAQALGLTDLYQVFHSRNLAPAGDNRYRVANPALDKLIDEIRSTPDEAARNALYIKAQQLFVELMPEITLCVPQVRVIVSKRFDHALTDNRPGYYVPFFALKK
jgi:peptide/nickel transport system substrate-binding protein